MATKTRNWGFDTRELDSSIRPQDDFFGYVNSRWMKSHEIPPSEARWGTFIELRYKTDAQLRRILQKLDALRRVEAGSPEQLIRDFYRSGMDMERRNARGAQPLEPWQKKIRSVKDISSLVRLLAEFEVFGGPGPWSVAVDHDSKDVETYLLTFMQSGLGMPDREYYLKHDAESVRVRTAYEAHIVAMCRLLGYGKKDAEAMRDTILAIETRLAQASMTKEDMRDPNKIYHKKSLAQLAKLTPAIDWADYLKRIHAPQLKTVMVMQPDFMQEVSRMLSEVSIADWQTYLEFHLANSFSGALSASFVRQSFSFYSTVLTGTKVMRPLWRRVLGVVNGSLGELLGQIYVKEHFPPAAKQKMNELIDDLFTAYENRLHSLEWMSPATKKKALKKLHALTRKIGYPDTWKTYKGLSIDSKDYVGNILRSNTYEHRRALKKLGKPIDRDEWHMYPQTVNAYFAPNLNDIVFPAAILQPPFFSFTADDALNYGCIGAVIGHEITHGFDDQGSQFDAAGNLKSWWTPEDRKRFETKAAKVEKQFNGYLVADGLHVNGKLTLGENIADLGGLSIAYDAYHLQLARTGRTDIDGLTPEQRFFIGFALFERQNVRPEFEKMQVLNDPHSPGKFRINGPISNFDQFYRAFGVEKTDRHYRAPKDREMVW